TPFDLLSIIFIYEISICMFTFFLSFSFVEDPLAEKAGDLNTRNRKASIILVCILVWLVSLFLFSCSFTKSPADNHDVIDVSVKVIKCGRQAQGASDSGRDSIAQPCKIVLNPVVIRESEIGCPSVSELKKQSLSKAVAFRMENLFKWKGCAEDQPENRAENQIDRSCLVKLTYKDAYGIELAKTSIRIYNNNLSSAARKNITEGDIICFRINGDRVLDKYFFYAKKPVKNFMPDIKLSSLIIADSFHKTPGRKQIHLSMLSIIDRTTSEIIERF
ncbi:hypothetical protein QUF76_18335, partial [Desulfobacterales bacterium HSG16]|nr:hypothetical protein [Desulfobacterales bacterium HSG16]